MRHAALDYPDSAGLDRKATVKYGLIFVAAGLLAWMLAGRLIVPLPEVASAPTIEKLKPIAALLTHKVVVTDTVVTSIAGFTGHVRAALIVKGDAVISIDLTDAVIEVIDRDARTVVIRLPPPKVVSARVDHRQTRIFGIESSGLWALVPTDDGRAELIDRALRLAQASVRRAASEPAILQQARTRAESLICTFIAETLGWSVEVQWIDSEQQSARRDARPRLPVRVVGVGMVASSLPIGDAESPFHRVSLRSCVRIEKPPPYGQADQ